MADPKAFFTVARAPADKRPAAERVGDWRELLLPRDEAEQTRQASRCMGCGIPFCHQGCPLGNRIPDFNALLARGEVEAAWRALASTNNFPELTGRLCPAPCEAACTLALNHEAVTIEQIELELAEAAWTHGWDAPRPPRQRSGRTVAVVGSGPAGLAAAQQLARAGHAVTVFERDDRIGGLLRYGIPEFKLEKRVIDRRVAQLEAEGVRFVTGAEVGVDPSWDRLAAEHDALLIAIGAGRPRDLDVPGRDLAGVHLAMEYLGRANRACHGEAVAEEPHATGRRVIVLGGGDTGSDCVGTAHRQGAASVRQIELFDAPPTARPPGNPWPRWPETLRTSTSHEEGGAREWGLMTTELLGQGGRIVALRAAEVDLSAGRPTPTDRHHQFDVDLLVLAMGFVAPRTDALVAQLGVALDARGNVAARDGRTSIPGVYVAGDAHRGASLIVWAIAEGREVARAIDADLVGGARLPTRGRDRAFGGR